jgi:iron complex transport system permease protein
MSGTISGRNWTEFRVAFIYIATATIFALILSKQLRLLSLGSQKAASLGQNVKRAEICILSTAVISCSAAVSLSGLVGFVGLIAPHIARNFFSNDERLQIIASIICGAVLVSLSDLSARTIMPNQELPLGTLLALIGGPFFLYLLTRAKHHDPFG